MSKGDDRRNKYFLQLLEWRRKYGVVEHKYGRDLTQISVTGRSRVCKKLDCNRTTRLHRHHKGHDYIFACLFPDIFAPRYILFHPDDVVDVCHIHHEKVHRYYKPVVDEFFQKFNVATSVDKQIVLCEEYKAKLTQMCEKFLRSKDRRQRVKRYR